MAIMNEIETTTPSLEGTIDGEGGVYLYLRNQRFECRRISVTWQMMQFTKAQRAASAHYPHNIDDEEYEDQLKHINGTDKTSGCAACKTVFDKRREAGENMMLVMHDMVLMLMKPYERDRFLEFMSNPDNVLDPNEFEEAITDVIAAVGNAQGKEKPATSSLSSDSPAPTNGSSAAISSVQGTDVPVVERYINPAKKSSTQSV